MESDVITLQDLFEFKIESIAADRTITGELKADRASPDVPAQVREARHRAPGEPVHGSPAARSPKSREGSGDHAATRRRSGARRRRTRCTAAARRVGASAATTASRVQIAQSPTLELPGHGVLARAPERPAAQRRAGARDRERKPVNDVTVDKPGAESPGAVLLIDASDSMAGRPIRERDGRRARVRRSPQPGPAARRGLLQRRRQRRAAADERRDARSTRRSRASPSSPTERTSTTALEQRRRPAQDAGIENGAIVLLSDGKDVGSTDRPEDGGRRVNGGQGSASSRSG